MRLLAPSLQFLTIKPAGEAASGIVTEVLPGRLAMRPQALISVGIPAAGRIATLRVRPGERIQEGAILATIRSADAAAARATLEEASAKAAAAEDVLRRQNEMMARGVGLEVERFTAETAAREARAEFQRARDASALLGAGAGDIVTVRAPSSGVIMSVKASVGAMVTPGEDTLAEIADATRLWLVVDVPEADATSIAKESKAEVFVPSQNRKLQGVIDGLGSQIDTETRRLPIYVALQGDLSGLTPGMQAEMRFANSDDAMLTLPVEAVLIKDGYKRIVYVQEADGRFTAREVRTGMSKGGLVQVLGGLQRGERVVVKGSLLLDTEAEQLL